MSNETAISGFWSYARKDDEAEGGRITDLGRDLARAYELLTGQAIDLFLDRDSLAWGERWREAIDSGVENSAFFVAVMTPAYFQSEQCRNELETFARSARDLGVSELVLPLKYVDFPGLDSATTDDPLVLLATDFQWQDWSDTRFADSGSEAYRRGVGAMAQRLAEVNRALDQRAARELAKPTPDLDAAERDAPGTLDLMETAERVLPDWQASTEGLTEEVVAVGRIFQAGSEELQEQESRGRATFAGRVIVARQIAQELVPHSERIRDLGASFVEQMQDVDAGVQAMLTALVDQPPDGEAAEEVCKFLRVMTELAASMRQGLGQMDSMLTASDQLARQSRDLRSPIGTMRQGLTAMRQGQAVADNWDRLISEIDIDCAGFEY